MLQMLNVNISSFYVWKVCTTHKATFIKSSNQGGTNCDSMFECHAFVYWWYGTKSIRGKMVPLQSKQF